MMDQSRISLNMLDIWENLHLWVDGPFAVEMVEKIRLTQNSTNISKDNLRALLSCYQYLIHKKWKIIEESKRELQKEQTLTESYKKKTKSILGKIKCSKGIIEVYLAQLIKEEKQLAAAGQKSSQSPRRNLVNRQIQRSLDEETPQGQYPIHKFHVLLNGTFSLATYNKIGYPLTTIQVLINNQPVPSKEFTDQVKKENQPKIQQINQLSDLLEELSLKNVLSKILEGEETQKFIRFRNKIVSKKYHVQKPLRTKDDSIANQKTFRVRSSSRNKLQKKTSQQNITELFQSRASQQMNQSNLFGELLADSLQIPQKTQKGSKKLLHQRKRSQQMSQSYQFGELPPDSLQIPRAQTRRPLPTHKCTQKGKKEYPESKNNQGFVNRLFYEKLNFLDSPLKNSYKR